MKIPEEISTVVSSDSDILGGTPCFVGTRVPLETFIDHVELGYSVSQFLEGYSSVGREQALRVLAWLGRESRVSIGLQLAS